MSCPNALRITTSCNPIIQKNSLAFILTSHVYIAFIDRNNHLPASLSFEAATQLFLQLSSSAMKTFNSFGAMHDIDRMKSKTKVVSLYTLQSAIYERIAHQSGSWIVIARQLNLAFAFLIQLA
ncbi:hypothetical protein JXJ21_07335 [candidate division KSB1 bacterium]|nr:hypothetical protein [candidate division KSB1 bacterium]